MSRSVRFCSDAFPRQPEDDLQVNAGRYGRALADFLAAKLRERGTPILRVAAEDWGWRVDIANQDFPLWIGCGNLDGEENAFLCFIEPSKETVGPIFRRKDARPATNHLAEQIYQVLAVTPGVTDLSWSD